MATTIKPIAKKDPLINRITAQPVDTFAKVPFKTDTQITQPFTSTQETTRQNIAGNPMVVQGVPTFTPAPQIDITAMQNQLAEAERQRVAAQLEKSRQAALSGLGQEKTLAEQQQRTDVGQARTVAAQGARSFNEYLANKGLANSGSAAQGELSRNIALLGAESNIGQNTSNTLQGIEAKRTLAETNYANDLASAYADIEASRQAGLISNAQAINARNDANAQFAANMNQQNYQFGVGQQNLQENRTLEQQRYDLENEIARQNAEAKAKYDAKIAADKKAQQDLENKIALEKLRLEQKKTSYSTSKPYYKASSSGTKKTTPTKGGFKENGLIN